MVFESLRRSFRGMRDRGERSGEEAFPPPRKPSSTNYRPNGSETVPDRRSSRRTANPKPGYGGSGRISKRPSASNLSESRLELRRVAAEEEIAKQRLGTVNEEGSRSGLPPSPSRKERLPSQQSSLSSQPARESRSRDLPQDLFDELITLRHENAVLKSQPNLSPLKTASGRDSAQWEEQARMIDELHRQLKAEKTRAKEAERGRNRLIKQLASSTKVESNLYDDAHFKDSVHQLRWQVYNWVKNVRWEYLRTRSRLSGIPTAYKFLKSTCPDYQEYLTSRRGVELLVQAYIWQFFVSEVFFTACFWAETRESSQAEKDIWNSPFALLRSQLREEIGPRYESDFQQWRVSSVRLLAKRDPKTVEASIAIATRTIMQPLAQQFKHIQSGDPHLRSLENIFRSAINLDYLMQGQTADYTFFPALSGDAKLIFDEDKFNPPDEEENLGDKVKVKLVIEPAFCKFGDAMGKNYDVESCLLKGEVDL